MSMRVGKHTDSFLSELLANTEGKMDCKVWYTNDWGDYERILPPEVSHIIGKDNTQRLERTNGIVRQQTSRWHRRQNKFGKLWEQTEMTARLAVSYFNWIWRHSSKRNTAAQRAGLAITSWPWHDFATYPTFYCCITKPSLLMKAACIGCKSSPSAMPSIVVISAPSYGTARAKQELIRRPSAATV